MINYCTIDIYPHGSSNSLRRRNIQSSYRTAAEAVNLNTCLKILEFGYMWISNTPLCPRIKHLEHENRRNPVVDNTICTTNLTRLDSGNIKKIII